MAGLIGDAPIYLNGVLSLLFVFVLPGLALVSFLDIPAFPRRWLVVLLTSLTTSHALVILVAALHLDPLLSFRVVTAALVVVVGVRSIWRPYRRPVSCRPRIKKSTGPPSSARPSLISAHSTRPAGCAESPAVNLRGRRERQPATMD